ncbi:MAG TPA: ISAs1 family transposase [Geodermatophilus sp.]|nr:ISAs1 family transposase [Geodermatophilus sp.]
MPAPASSLSALLPASATVPGPLGAGDSIGLVQALTAVPDPRRRRGRRHGLQSVLLLALQAVMAGASSWVAIAQWAATAPQALGVCGASPSAATFRRVLAAVDITAVEAALTTWVTGRQARARAQQPIGTTAAAGRTVLAVDGKTLRGSKAAGGQQTKLVCVYDHAHRLVLTQVAVGGGDEVAAFALALAALPELADVLVTADALHCQRGHADFLATRGGHYLFTVKGNQPMLRQELMRLPWAQAPGTRRRGTGHGRIESRSIKVIDLDGTDAQALFPGARRAIKVVRRRRIGAGKPSVEIVYAVTSLDHRGADCRLLADWLQGHWAIENSVHHVRDVTQREDASRIRLGAGPQLMAALRNTATNIARLTGHANIAAAQRTASWSPTAITEALHAA